MTTKDGSGISNTDSSHTPPVVNAVGVKIPPFWAEEPALWFAQLEGQFLLANITSDSTRFYHVVSNLEHKYAAEVKEIITNPPASGKYEKLRSELVSRLSASREQRLRQLLSREELGDRKPSQFLRHLRNLADTDMNDEFLRTLWCDRLPKHIQTILAGWPDTPLEKLADLADKINEVTPYHGNVATTSAAPMMPMFEDLNRRIEDLSRQVAALSTNNFRGRQRSRSRSNNRRRFNRSGSRDDSSGRCWYHVRFGARATKCRDPCSFNKENSRGSH